MKKSKILFITLIILLSLNYKNNILYAEEEIQDNVQDINKEKDEIITLINDSLSSIETKLKVIDDKIQDVKKQDEFEYYPAIRLNIDTPMFGITSLIENRLRVKKDISTSDVASKYSIRDIIKNRIIKLPESTLGTIVVSTKEYNIDKDMSLPQLKLTLIKTIQYLSQVNSVEEFIDTQINNTFKDYVSDDKKTKINDIKNRTNRASATLIDISDKINILSFLGSDISDYYKQYFQIKEQLYNINNSAKNSLMLDDELNELVKNSFNLESQILDLQTNITKEYDQKIKELDYVSMLDNIYNNYKYKVERMDNYIQNSTTQTKEIVNEKEEVKTTTNYEVTSLATLEYMKTTLKDIDTKKEEYKKLKESEQKDEASDKNDNKETENIEPTEEEKKAEENEKYEDNKAKIQELYTKYKDVLSREYRFYTNNVNMLLKDSNTKMSYIINQISSDINIDNEIFNYTKYIYIDLPDNLTQYIDKTNLNSMVEINNLTESLQVELKNLSNINNMITKMYDKVVTEVMKS